MSRRDLIHVGEIDPVAGVDYDEREYFECETCGNICERKNMSEKYENVCKECFHDEEENDI